MARGDDPLYVWQLPDGRWRGQVTDGYLPSGGPRRRYVHGQTKDEARTKKKTLLRQIAKGEALAGAATVKTWGTEWIAQQRTQVRPKTYLDYRTAVTKWIIPTIGKRKLSQLTPADVRAVGAAVRAAGLSTTTAALRQTILTKMLRDAVQEGHMVPARVLTVKRPAKAVHDRADIDLADALSLLAAAVHAPQPGRWVAALLQGMRQGECLGLTWECVDLNNRVMDVAWQLQSLPYEHGCRGKCGRRRDASCPERRFITPDGYEVRQIHKAQHLVVPKSARGRRLIPIVPPMAAALAALPHRTGLVWPRPNGLPQTVHRDIDAWHDLQDRARVAKIDGTQGRRYKIHELRHTAATMLMAYGVDETVRTMIMGHSSIATTRGYQHGSLDQARAALEGVAGRLGLTG